MYSIFLILIHVAVCKCAEIAISVQFWPKSVQILQPSTTLGFFTRGPFDYAQDKKTPPYGGVV